MPSVSIVPHESPNADLPVRLSLRPEQAPTLDVMRRVQNAADLFVRFAREGAFQEVKGGTTAGTSLVDDVIHLDLGDLPADQATLGVVGRMLLAMPDQWSAIGVQGVPAQRTDRALLPLQASLSMVPRLREPLRVKCEINTSIGWHCLELTRHAGWSVHGRPSRWPCDATSCSDSARIRSRPTSSCAGCKAGSTCR